LADIFVSHSSHDVALVDALIQLIEGGIGIRSGQIFCSSLEDQSIPPGLDFKSFVKEKLGEANVVIAAISPQYYNSSFCMCELGATWALTKSFIPLLVPPVNYADLRGSLFGSQALAIDEDKKLDVMQAVIVALATKPETVARWNSRKAQFLKQLPSLLKGLKPVAILSEKEANQLRTQRDEYKSEFEKADTEVATLRRRVAELEKLKDKAAVADIKRRYTGGYEQFDEVVKEAKALTDKLPRVVTEALYYSYLSEEFVPDRQEFGEEAQNALEDKLLNNDGSVFWPNSGHPKIRRAIAALDALEKFVREPPEGFSEHYEQEHDDLFSFTSRPFWKRHHLF
jgi:hypothetical protein